jgi:hypothetical protein
MGAINLIRQVLLRSLDLSQDRQCIIDTAFGVPIPVVQFHLVPASTGDWKAYQASFGYRLHVLITLSGLILDFELTPANAWTWKPE